MTSPMASQAPPTAAPTGRAGRGWRRAAGWLLVVALLVSLLVAGLGVAVWSGLTSAADAADGVAVTINGRDVTRAFDISGWPPAHKVVLVAVVALALLAAMLVVPLALLLGVGTLAVLLMVVMALPLLIGMVALAAVFAPLWLLVWWLAVRARRARPPRAATIDA